MSGLARGVGVGAVIAFLGCRPADGTATTSPPVAGEAGPVVAASEAAAHDASDGGVPGPRPYVVEGAEVRVLPSWHGGREYLLYVALPGSYADHPQAHYPVFYLCDGYWDFNLVKGFSGNLVYDKVAPEFILVGFGYPGDKPPYDNLRRGDLTAVPDPRAAADAGASGHAADFLATIEGELIPFVEHEYRVDPSYRVLGGSSLGGLFTLYAALTKPDLFQAYIAPSPAVNWANDWLFDYESAFFERGGRMHGRLFVTGAEKEWPDLLAAIKRFDARLRQRAYPGLVYSFRIIDGERHTGTKAESYNRGARFAFEPIAPLTRAAPHR